MKPLNTFIKTALLQTALIFAAPVFAAEHCSTIKHIEGIYQCSGECVIDDSTGNKTLITVASEQDTINLWPGSKHGIYQIDIKGGNGFREYEIGALVGNKMQTATANVTDGNYPVLEQYTFKGDSKCNAKEFTKTVLNPTQKNFKACVVICKK